MYVGVVVVSRVRDPPPPPLPPPPLLLPPPSPSMSKWLLSTALSLWWFIRLSTSARVCSPCVCLCACLFVYLSIYLSIYLSTYPSIYLSILSLSTCFFVRRTISTVVYFCSHSRYSSVHDAQNTTRTVFFLLATLTTLPPISPILYPLLAFYFS